MWAPGLSGVSLNNYGLQACTACSLSGQCYGQEGQPAEWQRPTQKVTGRAGDLTTLREMRARVYLMGEGPGKDEDLSGLPFVGESGQFLQACIHDSGLDQVSYYIGNTVRCRPPGNRKPTPSEIEACSVWTDLELSLVQPEVVVCLGASALGYFGFGRKMKGKVSDYVGKTFITLSGPKMGERWPFNVVGCYHPAARSAAQRNLILPVLTQVAVSLGCVPPPQEQTDYQIQEVL